LLKNLTFEQNENDGRQKHSEEVCRKPVKEGVNRSRFRQRFAATTEKNAVDALHTPPLLDNPIQKRTITLAAAISW
jgi:hypothetical protein